MRHAQARLVYLGAGRVHPFVQERARIAATGIPSAFTTQLAVMSPWSACPAAPLPVAKNSRGRGGRRKIFKSLNLERGGGFEVVRVATSRGILVPDEFSPGGLKETGLNLRQIRAELPSNAWNWPQTI
jgi:hypothetical protein